MNKHQPEIQESFPTEMASSSDESNQNPNPATGEDTTDAGEDTTDAKGFSFFKKIMRGTTKAFKGMYLSDVQDDADEIYYKRKPPTFSTVEFFSDVYKMDFPNRGRAIIVNNKNFSRELQKNGYGTRIGTDIDATKIGHRLELLGFTVDRYHDLTCKEMLDLFRHAASQDHSESDCFVAVLLSHGEEGYIFGHDDKIATEDLLNFFRGDKCETLLGKPKLFIIQACRGTQLDPGADVNVYDAKRSFDDAFSGQNQIRIPAAADFLVCYSTVPGFYAWRNQANGSWFIQALTSAIDKYGTTTEFCKILTVVNKMVANNFASSAGNPQMSDMKQVPSFNSMLTKDLFFYPKT